MVMKGRVGKRGGKKGGRRGVRKGRIARLPRRGVPERASLTEVFGTQTFTTNQSYSSYNLSLAALHRAQVVARGYQYYRIKRITYIVKPTMDTFTQGSASLPYLYYMIDRLKQFANGFTVDNLKQMGAKAHRLDDKTISFSYAPSVLSETYDNNFGGGVPRQFKVSPWICTRDPGSLLWKPDTTDHTGIVWRIEQAIGAQVAVQFERRVEVEFMKPAVDVFPDAPAPEDVPSEVDPLPVSLAKEEIPAAV